MITFGDTSTCASDGKMLGLGNKAPSRSFDYLLTQIAQEYEHVWSECAVLREENERFRSAREKRASAASRASTTDGVAEQTSPKQEACSGQMSALGIGDELGPPRLDPRMTAVTVSSSFSCDDEEECDDDVSFSEVPSDVPERPERRSTESRTQTSTERNRKTTAGSTTTLSVGTPSFYGSEGTRNGSTKSGVVKPPMLRAQSSGVANTIHEWQRRKSKYGGLVTGGDLRTCDFVKGTRFSILSACCIVANSVYIGVVTDSKLKAQFDRLDGKDHSSFSDMKYVDLVFCMFFSFELLCRLMADRWLFFFGRENRWNIFDLVVVVTSVWDLFTQFSGIDIKIGLSFLRTIRILRIIRVMRVARHIHIVQNLKTMLYSIAGSSTSFVSALLLLFAIIYIFGLLFMSGLLNHLSEYDPGYHVDSSTASYLSGVRHRYGSIQVTLWTLFAAVTGGYDWVIVADDVVNIGPLYTIAFLLYVSGVLLGLLNIMNGIFVNAALQSSAMNRELAIDAAMKARQHMITEMVKLFLEADEHASLNEDEDDAERGTSISSRLSGASNIAEEIQEELKGGGKFNISWNRFEEYMCDEGIKAYFMALDLDMVSLGKIFSLVDIEKTGVIDLKDFVDGCMRLRGSAKLVDISMLEGLHEELIRRTEHFERYMIQRLDLTLENQQALQAMNGDALQKHSEFGKSPPKAMSGIAKQLQSIQSKQLQLHDAVLDVLGRVEL